MTNTQLYFAMCVPTFAVLIGILINLVQTNSLRTEIAAVRTEIGALRTDMNAQISALRSDMQAQINILSGRIDALTGKFIEMIDRERR